jgi:carboxylesterase type B
MEKNGDPNAGLLDQRAMLRFVRDHISTIGGNPKQVSVWGESAGASSIMHHLVMPQNIQDPLFNRGVLMSPAYQWLWDRKGDMNDTFTQFLGNVSLRAECKTADMACLQSADSGVLHQVNRQIFQKQACEGVMPLGPSVDGRTIVDLAPNSFTKGQGEYRFASDYETRLTSASHEARHHCSLAREPRSPVFQFHKR